MQTEADAAESSFTLTPLGEAYVHAQLSPIGCPPGVEPQEWRKAVSRRVDQHLSLVTTLIAMIDAMDTDADLEPSLAGFDGGPTHDREGGDVLDARHDADDDGGGIDVSWSERGPQALMANAKEDDEDDGDSEPSLGSLMPGCGGLPDALAFWKVKPYWMSDEDWQRSLRDRHSITVPVNANWSNGRNDDREDEHDGAEPVNEDGGSWSEAGSMAGALDLGFGEDAEPSLGFTEHVDQAARTVMTDVWLFEDGEEDAGDMPEQVNEDGGDVLDEPHDANTSEDCEPSLGWPIPNENTCQGSGYIAIAISPDYELTSPEWQP